MHDPITYKVFSPHVHIVFLKNTGNVFDMASLQLLAIKPKSWRDLVSDEPFTREDIVTIQVSFTLLLRKCRLIPRIRQTCSREIWVSLIMSRKIRKSKVSSTAQLSTVLSIQLMLRGRYEGWSITRDQCGCSWRCFKGAQDDCWKGGWESYSADWPLDPSGASFAITGRTCRREEKGSSDRKEKSWPISLWVCWIITHNSHQTMLPTTRPVWRQQR